MIKDVRQATGNLDLQILLFSATFNDKVKNFAMKVVPGANQASGLTRLSLAVIAPLADLLT